MALSCSRFLQWDNSLCSPYHRLRCSDRSMPLPGRFILPFRCLWYSCENESTSFDAIDRISPAYMIGRETGDIMNIAVADIETLEYFFCPYHRTHVYSYFASGNYHCFSMVCKSSVCTGADPHLHYDQRCTASWCINSRTWNRYSLQGTAW